LICAAAALQGCGGQRSTLPPAPSVAGVVALANLARNPEVYADAQVTTVGVVAAARSSGARVYVLAGARGARIALLPGAAVAAQLGHRVRVSGLFSVSFGVGYEIHVSRVAPAGTL
jgi:hypothetical protein